jgi:hypothetical protein
MEGWTKRFTASGEKLEEAVKNYQELGFLVRLVEPEPIEACDGCPGEPEGTLLILTKPE